MATRTEEIEQQIVRDATRAAIDDIPPAQPDHRMTIMRVARALAPLLEAQERELQELRAEVGRLRETRTGPPPTFGG